MRYLACLHQKLCLCPALLLQMDLKLHLKITKIYKISNNDINVLQSSRTLKLTELRWVKKLMIPRERFTGFSLFPPHLFRLSAPPPLVFQLLSRWWLQSLHISAFIEKKYLLCRLWLYNCLDKISAILIKPLKIQLWRAFEQSKCDGSSSKKFGKI